MEVHNKDIGSYGEDISENYLKRLGYKILHKNFRCKFGEIDLIVSNKDFVCFIEVKSRYGTSFGAPAESVTYAKQLKISKTAQVYISMKNILDTNFRFDVIEVMLNKDNNNFLINHIENAFQQ